MKESKEFLAVVKRPGERASVEPIAAGEHGCLEALQALVGGMIEAVEFDELPAHITGYVNDEGLLERLAPNVCLPEYPLLVGPVVALGLNRRTGESEGLTETEAKRAQSYLNDHAVTFGDLVRLGVVRVKEL